MVVAIHAYGYTGLTQSNTTITNFLWFIISTIAVPIFFLIDGFLFCHKQSDSYTFDYKLYLLKSSKRLLLPWFIFSVGYTIFRATFEAVNFFPEKIILGQNLSQLILSVYTASVSAHLYFLLSLFIIRMVSIACYRLIIAPYWVSIIIFISYSLFFRLYLQGYYKVHYALPGYDPVLHAFWGMQYYLLGITLFKLKDLLYKLSAITALNMVILMIVSKSIAPDFPFLLIQYLYLLFVFCFLIAIDYRSNLLSTIGRNTMGIYLLHTPILLKGWIIISGTISNNEYSVFLLAWAGTFISSLWLTNIIKSIPYGGILFGEEYNKKGSQSRVVTTY